MLAELVDGLASPHDAMDLLTRAVDADPSAMVRDGGVIAKGYDAELDELRALSSDAGAFLVDLEARERARTGIATLRVEYNRVHGFYIEIAHAKAANVPDDYRRRQTTKNAERYITPELKAFEDRALSARERALAREKALYEQLLDRLAVSIGALQRIARALAAVDVLQRMPIAPTRADGRGPSWSSSPASRSTRVVIRSSKRNVFRARDRRAPTASSRTTASSGRTDDC